MNEQPEALRLADELDHGVGTIDRVRHEAAAELRRLYMVDKLYHAALEGRNLMHLELHKANAERWALLEALKLMLTHMGMDEDEWNKPTFDQARAAIAKCEENT